jgi:hypothetical protein
MFDILILSAEKDFNKIKYVYESIVKFIGGYNNICVISDVEMKDEFKIEGIKYYTDNEVINFDFSKFKGNVLKRKGWYVQQYIKLFQQVTSDDYLVVDSDIIFNKKIEIIKEGKPSFFFGRNQLHKPYFHFMKKLLNLERVYDYSFINEIMYIKRDYINEILAQLKVDNAGFFDLSVEILNEINHDAGMSEYEIYGNFVTKYFPDAYNYNYIKTQLSGKDSVWKYEEIEDFLLKYKDQDFDIISMHSWVEPNKVV